MNAPASLTAYRVAKPRPDVESWMASADALLDERYGPFLDEILSGRAARQWAWFAS